MLPAMQGFNDIAALLQQPDKDVACSTLDPRPGGSDAAPQRTLDTEAMAELRKALLDAKELPECYQRDERVAALESELASATGLGGRPRALSEYSGSDKACRTPR